MANVLITGTAGFIGFHLAGAMLGNGHDVIGIDGMTPYYDVDLKKRRHELLKAEAQFTALEFMLEDGDRLAKTVREFAPDIVIHLAAQPGVRYSIEEPLSYVNANLSGVFTMLEAVRGSDVKHLLMASTSSVYGMGDDLPYREDSDTNHPASFYAATKIAGEAMSHSYSHLYGIPITAFRFFTVYGPWARPDMALFKFARAMLAGEAIDVYNHGKMQRDFTYIDDLTEAVMRLTDTPPPAPDNRDNHEPVKGDSLSAIAPWRVVNIGTGRAVELMDYITALENALGIEAKKNMMDMQPGDVPATHASNDLLTRLTGFTPATPLDEGVGRFAEWFRQNTNR